MTITSRRQATTMILAGFISAKTWLGTESPAAAAARGTVFKSPSCGCCTEWVKILRRAGINLEVKDLQSLSKIKKMLQVPAALQSCHTAVIGNYVVEGHVPVNEIKRLLEEKPKAIGIAVPGMPIGSPGMEQGGRKDPYQVVLFHDGGNRVFAKY
jgi:hypothetical protein